MNLIDMQNIWTISWQASEALNTQTPLIARDVMRRRYIITISGKLISSPAAASQMIKDTSGNHGLFIDVVNIQ